MNEGKQMLGRRHVLVNSVSSNGLTTTKPAVVNGLHEIQVEGTFKDGTYLVTVHDPICTDDGDLSKALSGSFFPVPSADAFPLFDTLSYNLENLPGAVIVETGAITLNESRKRSKVKVTNRGDRPIQVGPLSFDLICHCRWDPTITSSRQTPIWISIEK
jgi:urease